MEAAVLNLINLVLGAALLAAGRRLFWLFVGAAGFLAGLELATRFWQGPELLAIVVGLALGVVFAVLAIFLQAVVIGIAGFLIGGYVLTALAAMFSVDLAGSLAWVVYVIGGVIGAALVILLVDWALIVLSSLAGASLVVQSLFPPGGTGGILFLILFVIGLVVQGLILQRERTAVPV